MVKYLVVYVSIHFIVMARISYKPPDVGYADTSSATDNFEV